MNFRFWVEFWCSSSAMYVVKMLWKNKLFPVKLFFFGSHGRTCLQHVYVCRVSAKTVNVSAILVCTCIIIPQHISIVMIISYMNIIHMKIFIYIYNQPHSFPIFWHQEGTGGTSHIECPVPQLYSFLGQKIVESFDTSHIECPVPPLCPVQLYLLHSFISSWAKKI